MRLTKFTTKSVADWQCGYLLRAVVVSRAWPGHMLTWFFSHMVALVGGLAGFLVPFHPDGLPPPLLIFSNACQCDGCLDAWHRGSWLMAHG